METLIAGHVRTRSGCLQPLQVATLLRQRVLPAHCSNLAAGLVGLVALGPTVLFAYREQLTRALAMMQDLCMQPGEAAANDHCLEPFKASHWLPISGSGCLSRRHRLLIGSASCWPPTCSV